MITITVNYTCKYRLNLTSFNNIGTTLTVANGGIAWVDYPNKINVEE